MKTRALILIVISFFFNNDLKAQIKKSAIIIGGNVQFFKNKYDISIPTQDPIKQTNITFNPSFGKATKTNLVLGVNLDLTYSISHNFNNTIDSKMNHYGINFFARKYKDVSRNFYLFIQANLFGYSEIRKYHRIHESETIKGRSVGVSFYPGLSYALNKTLHLEIGLENLINLYYTKEDRNVLDLNNVTTSHYKMNTFGFQSSFNNSPNFSIGFRLLINK